MEWMSGGDLLNLLIERDVFEESFARFYVAEMVLAIDEAHNMGKNNLSFGDEAHRSF